MRTSKKCPGESEELLLPARERSRASDELLELERESFDDSLHLSCAVSVKRGKS